MIRFWFILQLILLFYPSILMAQNFSKNLFEKHSENIENALFNRRFTHADLQPLILKYKNVPGFEISEIGKSVQGRAIQQIKIGAGPKNILLWSQMHGDEATATMAIFDIFNFFAKKNEFEQEKNEILKQCTLYFVPMLNPDGAQVFERRNALGIDLNRDALRLQSPEAILLKKLQNELKPFFGFNLHDQSLRYAVGNTGKQTTIAFLATAYNDAREVNEVRKRSMQLIVSMNRILQNFIPEQVARFSDEFEPRAFGDNIQKWGTSLVLIESGGYKNDTEKQFIRKLNYVTIVASLHAIATGNYESENIAEYSVIPENNRVLFDLLIRNANAVIEGRKVKIDIGINKEEVAAKNVQKFNMKATIEDLGDLSTFYGIEEIEAEGLDLISEKSLKLNSKPSFSLFNKDELVYQINNGLVQKSRKN